MVMASSFIHLKLNQIKMKKILTLLFIFPLLITACDPTSRTSTATEDSDSLIYEETDTVRIDSVPAPVDSI
jgi:hypothetical protein